jgi:hypothetical protein
MKPTVLDLLQATYQRLQSGQVGGLPGQEAASVFAKPVLEFQPVRVFRLQFRGDPSVTRNTNGFLWTNISKFDCNSTTPSDDLQEPQCRRF